MTLHCIEFSHHQTPIAIREQLNLSEGSVANVYKRIQAGEGQLHTVCILSTCNRTEVYAVGNEENEVDLQTLLAEATGMPAETLAQFERLHYDAQAVKHLLRTACGLESQVVGEPQILGQVNRAGSLAIEGGVADKEMQSLFQLAVRTGKRARSETTISRHAASVGSIAVKLAEQTVGSLSGKHVALVGTGAMGQLVLTALRGAGATQISLLNRTPEHAVALAEKFSASVQPLTALNTVLAHADVLISATGSREFVVTESAVSAIHSQRKNPLTLIDISVPRNIDPACGILENVALFDMDQLSVARDSNLQARQAAIPAVEVIIEEAMIEWQHIQQELAVRPQIIEMRRAAEALRAQEFEKLIRRTPNLSPELQEELETFSRSLVNKLLHEPTKQLRENGKPLATNGQQPTTTSPAPNPQPPTPTK